jgi:hypothetical protein
MVSAKISAYIAHARVLPIQKNHPVKKASGLGRVRWVGEDAEGADDLRQLTGQGEDARAHHGTDADHDRQEEADAALELDPLTHSRTPRYDMRSRISASI